MNALTSFYQLLMSELRQKFRKDIEEEVEIVQTLFKIFYLLDTICFVNVFAKTAKPCQ